MSVQNANSTGMEEKSIGKLAQRIVDDDPQETAEWLDAWRYVIAHGGERRAEYLLERLKEQAMLRGVHYAGITATPYVNTIHVDQQPEYPGDRAIERRLKSIIRWNAMAMVVRANQQCPGIGGHLSSFASAATLYEVAFNHFLHGVTVHDFFQKWYCALG